jgi:dolichyl-phosphate beta-glucosyltransferase
MRGCLRAGLSVLIVLVCLLGSGHAGARESDLKVAPPCETALVSLRGHFDRVNAWIQAQGIYNGNRPFLSIVIPAYREEARLPASIAKIRAFFDEYPLPVEVLIMVEKSPDRTVETAHAAADGDPRIQVIDNKIQRGKGYAVRSGIQRAAGQMVLFMDADLSTPLDEVILFLDRMRERPDIDVLIGDRSAALNSHNRARGLHRRIMSRGFKGLIHTLSPLDFPDTQAGFKMLRAGPARRIFRLATVDQFAFDVEILLIAKELGYAVASQSIQWVDDERSTVHPLWDPLKMLRDVLKMQLSVKNRVRILRSEAI